MSRFLPTIGLEIHAEVKTETKMFCACRNDPNERHPNINVCPVCLGHPGTLPAPNREAIRLVQRFGAALGSEIAAFSKFDRKNYFYPDLPKGYQISQYDLPLCRGGSLTLQSGKTVRLTRIHLEEDTGRLLHPEGADETAVDFNRAGVPLLELVTEPDLHSAEGVVLFAEELQRILRYLGASDANMEKGQFRIEINISLCEIANGHGGQDAHRRGNGLRDPAPMGTKVEIKNLNSIRSARLAVAYEIERQSGILRAGKAIVQETRGWHDQKQATFSQREKEGAHDYRYFPEPDIPPLRFTDDELNTIRAGLPEIPAARRRRFQDEYGLSDEDVAVFVDDRAFGDFFENVTSDLREWASSEGVAVPAERLTKLAASYLLSDLRGLMVEHASAVEDLAITAENFSELIKIIAQEKVTSRAAKDVLREMFSTGRDPSDIVEERGLAQISDEGAIRDVIARVIAENPKPVADFLAGKEAALQFLVGKIMAASAGKANPDVARKVLRERIERESFC